MQTVGFSVTPTTATINRLFPDAPHASPSSLGKEQTVSTSMSNFAAAGDIEQSSFHNLAALKVQTSRVAMHLRREDRDRIFKEIDYLLDPEDFDAENDNLIDTQSFLSYLRFLTYSPRARPATLGVGVNGEVIAVWTSDCDRFNKTLNVEFLPDDRVKCSFTCVHEQEIVEAASYLSSVKRLDEILSPFDAKSLYQRET